MTTNPCTSCKHYKPELTCKLTGLSTSQSRAYKTDEDDCFQQSHNIVSFPADYEHKLSGTFTEMTSIDLDGLIDKDGE